MKIKMNAETRQPNGKSNHAKRPILTKVLRLIWERRRARRLWRTAQRFAPWLVLSLFVRTEFEFTASTAIHFKQRFTWDARVEKER
jgi:hypothetical protein